MRVEEGTVVVMVGAASDVNHRAIAHDVVGGWWRDAAANGEAGIARTGSNVDTTRNEANGDRAERTPNQNCRPSKCGPISQWTT